MKPIRTFYLSLFLFIFTLGSMNANAQTQPETDDGMLFRIAEIEVFPQYLQEYLQFAKSVGEISVKTEAGVICIFPMQVKENPNLIRILEIYRNKEAYDAHIASPHFQHYKTATPHMIKSLKLVDTNALNKEMMDIVFKKSEE